MTVWNFIKECTDRLLAVPDKIHNLLVKYCFVLVFNTAGHFQTLFPALMYLHIHVHVCVFVCIVYVRTCTYYKIINIIYDYLISEVVLSQSYLVSLVRMQVNFIFFDAIVQMILLPLVIMLMMLLLNVVSETNYYFFYDYK